MRRRSKKYRGGGYVRQDGKAIGASHEKGGIQGVVGTEKRPIEFEGNEWVMQTRAVKHYGDDFMRKVNNMEFKKGDTFRKGGKVRRKTMRRNGGKVRNFRNGGPTWEEFMYHTHPFSIPNHSHPNSTNIYGEELNISQGGAYGSNTKWGEGKPLHPHYPVPSSPGIGAGSLKRNFGGPVRGNRATYRRQTGPGGAFGRMKYRTGGNLRRKTRRNNLGHTSYYEHGGGVNSYHKRETTRRNNKDGSGRNSY